MIKHYASAHASIRRWLSLMMVPPALFALSACGGDSGVNSTPAPTPTPPSFTSFSAVQAGASTTISGSTREGSLVVGSNGAILPTNVTPPTEGSGSVTFSINSQKQITGLSVSGTSSNVSFDSSSIYSSVYAGSTAVATAVSNASGSNQAIYVDPYAVGFNYQSFGVWGTGLVAGSNGKYGAISAGAKTSSSSVPTSGSAAYVGVLGGIYVNNSGTGYRYAANANFSVNFAQRSISLSTSGDSISNIATNLSSLVPSNITGNFTYGAGSNNFSGPLAAGSYMSGTASGAFYGPTANELGGTFFMNGPAGALVGGFGAK